MSNNFSKQSIVALAVSILFFCIVSAWAADDTPDNKLITPDKKLIDINSASIEQLCEIPGVGKTIAQRIVKYREANGPFKTTADIQKVKGIGSKKFEKIKDLIAVTEQQ